MRLRNWKETIPYTIEDTLLDVQPHSLEETFHWCPPNGAPVWVNVPDADGCKPKWRKGMIMTEEDIVYSEKGIFRSYVVMTTIKRKPVNFTITPGMDPSLKPDSPEVRELLRHAGVHV